MTGGSAIIGAQAHSGSGNKQMILPAAASTLEVGVLGNGIRNMEGGQSVELIVDPRKCMTSVSVRSKPEPL